MPRPTTPKERSYGGLTRAERDAQRRRRLLDAGLEAFGSTGYPATSVEAICSAAGVSSRSFYEYFDGREGLLIAVYDEIVETALRMVADAFAATPQESGIRTHVQSGLHAFTGYMLGDERRARVNFIEVVGASRKVEEHRRRALRQFADLLREAMTALMAAGRIRDRPSHEVAVTTTAVIGAVQETLTDWMSREDRLPLEQVLAGLVEVFVVLAGSAAAPDDA